MASPYRPVTESELQRTKEALESVGWINTEAASILDISEAAVRRHRKKIIDKAKKGDYGTSPTIPGFEITKVSTTRDADGDLQREHIQQKPERDDPEPIPDGFSVKRISRLSDGQGRAINQWDIFEKGTPDPAVIADALIEKWQSVKFKLPDIPKPTHTEKDLLTLYPLADWHIGMMAWGDETVENWDLKIARKALAGTMGEIFSATPASKTAVILGTGDFLHSDSKNNVTERNRHPLDVDGRYQKVLEEAQELAYEMVCLALGKHDKVVVRFLPGNHDEYSAIHITGFLRGVFRENKRVTVDNDPSLYWVHQHGKTLLAATHGHTIKPQALTDFLTSAFRKEWGESDHTYAFVGHFHHKERLARDHAGAIVEVLPAPIPPDAYTYGAGYMSGRAMTGITYHNEHGEISRDTRTLRNK